MVTLEEVAIVDVAAITTLFTFARQFGEQPSALSATVCTIKTSLAN